MSYPSVDALQKVLCENVFHYAKDQKKAAGRALGTLVEIITFYTLRSWGFRDSVAIERPLPEYRNDEITHNVEYSIHPILEQSSHTVTPIKLPITGSKLRKAIWPKNREESEGDKNIRLLSADNILRNSCTITEDWVGPQVVHLDSMNQSSYTVKLSHLHKRPFAIFECKRVGVEEGMSKGPQTIEKAKQGAYVARTVSSLQKVRLSDGRMGGLIEKSDGSFVCDEYNLLIERIVESGTADELRNFILTVGVVSNHGNWFTAENQNKELKVLAQSYDWLIFLKDQGLAEFISELLLEPTEELAAARNAFLASYNGEKTGTRFTKVQVDRDADAVLVEYFKKHKDKIESWFEIISPKDKTLTQLRYELSTLIKKDWKKIHNL